VSSPKGARKPRKTPDARPSAAPSVLPMQLQVGDRFTDETGEWEITSYPYTIGSGKVVYARVQKVPAKERSGNLGVALALALSGWQPGRNAAPVQQVAHTPVVLGPTVSAAHRVVGAQHVAAADLDTAQGAEAHRSTSASVHMKIPCG